MTVSELIKRLECMNQAAEVRFASQPNNPIECSLNENIVSTECLEPEEDVWDGIEDPIVYLAEGTPIGYPSDAVIVELGWKIVSKN